MAFFALLLPPALEAAQAAGALRRAPVTSTALNASELASVGKLLANQYLMLVEAAGKAGGESTFLKPLMSPAYQIVRADGVRETPSTYTPPDLQGYNVSDVIVTAPTPDILVIRYAVVANETVAGRPLNNSRRPRLTVLARGPDGGAAADDMSWRIVSQASFNEPMELECDRGDGGPPPPPAGPAADLGMQVLQDWMKYVAAGIPTQASNFNIQVQFANGSGFTTTPQLEHIAAMPIDGVSNLVATRCGRLLVLSYNATTRVAKRGRPHLTVFLEDGGPLAGNFSMIAQANFNAPKLPPTDPQCAKNGAGGGLRPCVALNILVAAPAALLLGAGLGPGLL